MPEKKFIVNNKGYVLNFGVGQEDQLTRLLEFINQRLKPYAERFSQYSESYLMLLLLIELSDELDKKDEPSSQVSDQAFDNRLKFLAQHATALVKKADAQ